MTRKYVGNTYTDNAGKFSVGSGVGGKFAEGGPMPDPQKKPSAFRELPKIEIKEDGEVSVNLKSEEQAKTLFGSDTVEFAVATLHQCLNVSGTSGVLLKDGKDALAIVAELAPNDGIEALLTTQMAAVHIAMMRQSRRLTCADTIQELDIYERTFNKLARTFTAQTEALRKHRTGGQKKMTVEHVTINEGGQAIVGNILREGVTEK